MTRDRTLAGCLNGAAAFALVLAGGQVPDLTEVGNTGWWSCWPPGWWPAR